MYFGLRWIDPIVTTFSNVPIAAKASKPGCVAHSLSCPSVETPRAIKDMYCGYHGHLTEESGAVRALINSCGSFMGQLF